MEFGFSEEQQELATTVRSLLANAPTVRPSARPPRRRAATTSRSGSCCCEQIGVAAPGIP